MAHVSECIYCGRSTLNSSACADCQVAHLEDLIYTLQEELENGDSISPKLREKIAHEGVQSWDEFIKQRTAREQKKAYQEFWNATRQAHLQDCAREWEERHPEPNPTQYA